MTTSKNKKIIYWTLYGLIFVFTAYFAFTFISKSIAEKKDFEIFKESWQYVADTNFKQSVEIDPETNEQKVYYEISTPEQLAGAFLSESSVSAENTETISNKTYRLTNNVDLKGKTWQVESVFSKTFDGNSYHIQNLTINNDSITSSSARILGFVGTLYGTIKNIYFDNLNVSTSKRDTTCYVGGVAGKAMYGSTISNVYINSGDIHGSYLGSYSTFNQDREVGGIVGFLSGGTIKNSINKASLDYGKHIGGIVGYINSGSVSNCINQGNVCASDGVYMRVGGIAGEISSGTLKLCENTGKIYTNINKNKVVCYNLSIGGIVGVASRTIEQCSNKGDVDGGNKWVCNETMAGGIVGQSSASIKDCYNTGNINGSAYKKTLASGTVQNNTNVKFADRVGRFWAFSLSIVSGTYTNSKGSGEYKDKKQESVYEDTIVQNVYRGGICGSGKNIKISNCYNIGTVDSTDSEIKRTVSLYFKWKANDQYNMWIADKFTFGVGYNYDTICPNSNNSWCFDASKTVSYKELSKVNLTQSLYVKNKSVKTNEIKNGVVQGTNTGRNCDWYIYDSNGCEFRSIHAINCNEQKDSYGDLSGYNLVFWVQFTSQYQTKDQTVYYVYNIDKINYNVSASGSTYQVIKNRFENLGSWDTSGELPKLNDLYW